MIKRLEVAFKDYDKPITERKQFDKYEREIREKINEIIQVLELHLSTAVHSVNTNEMIQLDEALKEDLRKAMARHGIK